MSYQPRLDRLEAEVFNTSIPQTNQYQQIMPYILIFVITLISLYTFCPDPLRVKRDRQYHLRTGRFTTTWIIVSIALSLIYYKFLSSTSEKNTD